MEGPFLTHCIFSFFDNPPHRCSVEEPVQRGGGGGPAWCSVVEMAGVEEAEMAGVPTRVEEPEQRVETSTAAAWRQGSLAAGRRRRSVARALFLAQ